MWSFYSLAASLRGFHHQMMKTSCLGLLLLGLWAHSAAHSVVNPPTYTAWVAEWSEWGNYSTCTASCGGGIKMRTRECVLKKVHHHYFYNVGIKPSCCAGASVEVEPCNTHMCVIIGGWSPWSINTGCCNGMKIRHRSCTNPTPVNSPECTGPAVESVMCGPKDKEICVGCPRDCPRPSMFYPYAPVAKHPYYPQYQVADHGHGQGQDAMQGPH